MNYKNGPMLKFIKCTLFLLTSVLLMGAMPVPQIDVQSEAFELEVIRLANQERISRGLAPLRRSDQLTTAARAHNQDMIVNDFFSHTGSNGSSSAQRACASGYQPYGWGACYVGENIAVGYSSPAAVMTGWMNSSGHRANILNPDYREIGVGHATGGSWGNYWTMDLGAQPNVLPIFINSDAAESTINEVTVTLTKEDVSSWGSIGAITSVQLSEDPGFGGAAWQPWANELSFELTHGSEQKTVYAKFTDGSNQVVSSDTIMLNEPFPTLTVSPGQITFLVEAGSGQILPTKALLQINNGGGDSLDWSANDNKNWLDISASGGKAPGFVEISINNNTGILDQPIGTVENAVVTVTSGTPNALNSPQTVIATVQIVDQIHKAYLPMLLW
jgi:uncharacterized protein YkwD